MNTSDAGFREKFLVEERFMSREAKRNLYVTAAGLITIGLAGFLLTLRGVLLNVAPATIDAPLKTWLYDGRSDFLTGIMIGLAVGFGPIALPIIILVVVVTWAIIAKHIWRPMLLAAGTTTGVVLALTITHAVGRHRPPTELMLFGADSTFSFPSGHVLGACNFLLLLTYLVFSRRHNPRAEVTAFILVGLLIVAVALSRIYLGYHWATDAVASISLSLVILGAVIAVDTQHTVRVSAAPSPGGRAASPAP